MSNQPKPSPTCEQDFLPGELVRLIDPDPSVIKPYDGELALIIDKVQRENAGFFYYSLFIFEKELEDFFKGCLWHPEHLRKLT